MQLTLALRSIGKSKGINIVTNHELFQSCLRISHSVPGSYRVCFMPQGVEFGKISVLVVLLLWGIKKRKTPWECSFLENCYPREPCVQMEARGRLKGLVKNLSTGAAQSVPRPRAKADVGVHMSQGKGSLRGTWSLGSHLFLHFD